jgi:hypothetical protein
MNSGSGLGLRARGLALVLVAGMVSACGAAGEPSQDPIANPGQDRDVSTGGDTQDSSDTGGGAGEDTSGLPEGDTETPSPEPGEPPPAIPEIARWETRMLDGAEQFCVQAEIAAAIGPDGAVTESNVWYYDGTDVYQQIAHYTGDARWSVCAGYVRDAYRSWVLATTEGVSWPVGRLNGWRIFSQGLLTDWRLNQDTQSREAVRRIALYSPFAERGGAPECDSSRETAYLLNAYLAAEEAGEPAHSNLPTAVDYALGHLDGWFVSQTCDALKPFMAGLTMEALMYYYERTGDDRVPPALERAADALWAQAWVPDDEAFWYESNGTGAGAPDLNLLIAPVYAWLWQRTGEERHLERGDAVFAGGVRHAGFWSGKQFSQSYRSSFDYVHWRSAPAGTYARPPRYLP